MLFYFVSWTLDYLDPGIDEILSAIDKNWKEQVLQSEGVHRHRAKPWKRKVQNNTALYDSYCLLYKDLKKIHHMKRQWIMSDEKEFVPQSHFQRSISSTKF